MRRTIAAAAAVTATALLLGACGGRNVSSWFGSNRGIKN
jgi:hypothetical protein